MGSTKARATVLEGVEIECTHCGVKMVSHLGGGGTVRYFHCEGCKRWGSSMYPEAFTVAAKMRRHDLPVRERLEEHLGALAVPEPV